MPFVAQVCVGRRAKLSVFGNDYNTPDGTGTLWSRFASIESIRRSLLSKFHLSLHKEFETTFMSLI